jgi:DNA-binding CsgD family transcriptional regulator
VRTFNQSAESEALPYRSTGPEAVGLILLDAHMKVVYVSSTARHILSYQHSGKSGAPPEDQLFERIQSAVVSSGAAGGPASALVSGRRRYLCRSFLLEPTGTAPHLPHAAILLERRSRRNDNLRRLVQQFKLTRREREALLLLAEGLTSKEIACRMNISPHTVRAFLHIIMIKLGVSTRSGIVGKVNASFKAEEPRL